MKRAALVVALLGWGTACRKAPSPLLSALEEILVSKNDNDPRLDTAFNALSGAEKTLFREKYRSLPPEKRNERGTIVYLLGKNGDWEFLREAAAEPPCLSLSDCAKAAPEGLADEVTLAYPSLVALKQAQRSLEAGADPAARSVIDAGLKSKAPAVLRLARVLDRRFKR